VMGLGQRVLLPDCFSQSLCAHNVACKPPYDRPFSFLLKEEF
jgi:hypothetical protein